MGLNFNDVFTGAKRVANGVDDVLKENPLERAYNSVRDLINGIGGRNIPEPGNTITDFFIPKDASLTEGYDDWERLINYNVTDKQVLGPLVGNIPNDQLVFLFNTTRKFNLNTELQTLIEGALVTDPPQSFARLIDLNRSKFTYGINDYVNHNVDSMYDDVVDKIEDPTILSFTLEIDRNSSMLFEDDEAGFLRRLLSPAPQMTQFLNFRKQEYSGFINSLEGFNSLLDLNPYMSHEQVWRQIKATFIKFFNSFDTDANTATNKTKAYYIKEISDVNNLDKVWTGKQDGKKFELDYITVKMVDDVKMSARSMAMFYNTFKYHRQSGKEMIPENLLRFNMWIKISEIRNYTSLRQYIKGNNSAREIIRAIKKDVTSLYYYVQDCEFDFDNIHSDTNQKYSAEAPKVEETLTFKIRFRRAHRVFKPTLLYSTTSPSSGEGAFVFHIDERNENPFISQKYYTQESTTRILSTITNNNLNLPFNSLMTGRGNTIFKVRRVPRRRTLVPDGLIKGSALFRDKINQNTADEIGVRGELNTAGGFLRTVANLALNVGEAALESGIGTSIRGVQNTIAQRLIRGANTTLTRMRNELVRSMKTKIKNEDKLGMPSPTNVYAPTNSKAGVSTALAAISRLTGVNFNAQTQNLNPSLKGRPINVGNLQEGFYNTYSINPNNSSILEKDPRTNTINYQNGIINKIDHSTYQQTREGNNAVGFDNITQRPEPKGDVHPDVENVMDPSNLKNLHPIVEQVNTDELGDLHPDVNYIIPSPDIDVHPDVNYKVPSPDADLHPDVNYKVPSPDADLHPDVNYIVPSPDADLHPDVNYIVPSPDADLHPDVNYIVPSPDADLHPDANYIVPSPDADLHPDVNYKVPSPDIDLHPDVDYKVPSPDIDLHPDVDYKVPSPDADLHPDVNYKSDEQSLKNVTLDESKPKKSDQKDNDLGNVDCE